MKWSKIVEIFYQEPSGKKNLSKNKHNLFVFIKIQKYIQALFVNPHNTPIPNFNNSDKKK